MVQKVVTPNIALIMLIFCCCYLARSAGEKVHNNAGNCTQLLLVLLVAPNPDHIWPFMGNLNGPLGLRSLHSLNRGCWATWAENLRTS